MIAETPQALLARMAAALAGLRDPWARHWLVIPGLGRGEWVRQAWAGVSGIAAHSQILAVRALVELAAAGPLPKPRFSLERLALVIAEALPACDATLTAPGPIDAPRLAWARQLADALDNGLLCREEAAAYGTGSLLPALAADPAVAAVLADHLAGQDAAAFRAAASAWMRDWDGRGGVPHCWIQLDVGLPRLLMARLLELLALLPPQRVHVFVLAPSAVYWEDCTVGRRLPDDPADDPGPVLRAFGRRAQDLHAQLLPLLAEGSGGGCCPVQPVADNLLGRLQASCRELTPPAPVAAVTVDHSFSVHACRSPLRELEVCRDRILQALDEDPTLRPEEIQVLLADPATYAPLVAAAFTPQAEVAARLPVRTTLAAGSLPATFAEGVTAVLEAVLGRCDQAALLALLEHPLVAARFGLDGDTDPGELLGWLQDAGFRWGLDGDHRRTVQGGDGGRWHLAFALRRLAYGATVAPGLADGVVAGVAPLVRAGGVRIRLLCDLAVLAEALATTRATWLAEPARSLEAWSALLSELIAAFLAEGDPVAIQQRNEFLHRQLAGVERSAPEVLLDAGGFRRLIRPLLDGLAGAAFAGGSGVTVASLAEMAGTPARMICICGLGDERFPRREERSDWHPLASGRRRGDPDRRDDDRHALLLALLATGERLVLTYEGGSDSDDRRRPPSTPLADLMAAAEQACPDSGRWWLRHPLNGFTPQAHSRAASPLARGYLQADARAARILTGEGAPCETGPWQTVLPEAGERRLSAAALRGLLREPCHLFLERLGVALPEEAVAPEAGDRLELAGLAAWAERRRLLDLRLRGGDEAALRERLDSAGTLPPLAYGHASWDGLSTDTPQWDVAARPLQPIADPEPIVVTIDGEDWTILAATAHAWYQEPSGACHCFTASKRSLRRDGTAEPPSKDLPFLLDLLLMAAGAGVSAVTVHFAQGGCLPLRAPPPETTRALLADLVRLYALARRVALPWWPETHDAWYDLAGPEREPQALTALADRIEQVWTEEPDGGRSGRSAPARLPATRLAFRGCSAVFAWPGPANLPVAALPAAEGSLAARLFVAIDRIYQAAHRSLEEAAP